MSAFKTPDPAKVKPEMASMLESAFQNGAGRAQVRNWFAPYAIAANFDTLAAALRYVDDTHYHVYWRAKLRGERRYEWVRVE